MVTGQAQQTGEAVKSGIGCFRDMNTSPSMRAQDHRFSSVQLL